MRQWFLYGWPLIINYALGLSLAYTSRFLLSAFKGPVEVGRFAATYDPMFAMITLTTALIGLTSVPRIFAASDPKDQARMLRSLRTKVLVGCSAISLAIAISWPIFSTLLIGERLRVTEWNTVLPLIAAFGILAYRFQYQNIRFQLLEQTGLQTVATGIGLSVNVLCSLVLIPNHGVAGAAYATLISAVAAAASGFALNMTSRAVRRW